MGIPVSNQSTRDEANWGRQPLGGGLCPEWSEAGSRQPAGLSA